MKTREFIQLHFLNITPAQNDNLVALLANIAYNGFEEEENSLKAFIDEKNFNRDELDVVLKIIPAEYLRSTIKEQNWNAEWESSFEPIVVSDFAAIRAGFHHPIKNIKHEIIITPKMSFGTGHHATTYMMIEQMEGLDLMNKAVVDFGTGTAVLAILAEKMGASNVDAIDNDDWSIENATENIAANDCTKIKLHKAESISGVYDIILANINLNVIQANLDGIVAACKKGTIILLSGFLRSDEPVLVKELSLRSITHLHTLQKREWICLLTRMD